MCPPVIAAIIPAVAGIASSVIGAAAAGGSRPQQPTAGAGGAAPGLSPELLAQLAQTAQLFGGAVGGGPISPAAGGAQLAGMPATVRGLEGKRAPDEVPYRAPDAHTLGVIRAEQEQRPLQRQTEQAGRAIVRRIGDEVSPQLAAIRADLRHRANQIEATAEHRNIVDRDAFRRRVLRDLSELRRDVRRVRHARY